MGPGVSRVLCPPNRINTQTRAAAFEGGGKRVLEQNLRRHTVKAGRDNHQQGFLPRCRYQVLVLLVFDLSFSGSDQAYRAISTGQLSMLPCLHLRPIDVVVFHGPQGDLVLRGASRLDAFSGYPVRS